MGPYCKFCDQRCFAHIPSNTPDDIVAAFKAYRERSGFGLDILATCPAGQAFDKQLTGYSYGDIQAALAERSAP